VSGFTHRLATEADIPALKAVMDAAISGPLADFLTPEQVTASRLSMGLDTQLIADRTYFVIEAEVAGETVVAGCGGWSRRATMYGGDHSPTRQPTLVVPGIDAARVRAMYTRPDFLRQGVGRLILDLAEAAAAAEGFDRVELVATMGGEPLYLSAGYREIERFDEDRGGVSVPLVRMGKNI
jgi:GNAT superfamily N-acetyltransferase